ncbi:NAD(P)/FAD-dependent oxidoreductase [Bradyrhizobium sp. SYSU BS000235]|uniref:NAD(P)/FAD-dependent oxidoreductase n=1 Tax=Bradyrhizobium sp. SYSU BS000235 TaxID=3411332 RepID=UPI003C77736E
MSNIFGRRAVVIGAGFSGLPVAAVLAKYFEQVVILERDQLDNHPASRVGTPQDRHPHLLLAGGLNALDEICPGYSNELESAGAVAISLWRDAHFERADIGVLPKRDFGTPVLLASRPLFEFVLRRKVLAIGNIELRTQCRVMSVLSFDGAVRGVRFESESHAVETLEADLVVDASGRARPTLELLDELDYDRPDNSEVGPDITYSTVVVKIPPQAAPHAQIVRTFANLPESGVNAAIGPIEGGESIAFIVTPVDVPRPNTWEAYLDLLRGLITPTLFNILRQAKTPKCIDHFGFPTSVWRHFEQMSRLPRGILPVGDSICRFNPTYGQGMSVAAQEARLLQDVLASATAEPDPVGAMQAEFLARVAAILQTPWDMSTNTDFAFPKTRGQRPENFADMQEFDAALFRAAVVDPVVQRAFVDVAQLLQPGSILQEPDIKERIAAASARVFA